MIIRAASTRGDALVKHEGLARFAELLCEGDRVWGKVAVAPDRRGSDFIVRQAELRGCDARGESAPEAQTLHHALA